MTQWNDGETRNVPGRPYVMKYIGGVYSCSCIAWKCQSLKIDQRSCKHLRAAGVTQGVAGAAGAQAPAPAPIAASATAGQPSASASQIAARAAAAGRALRPDEKTKLNGPKILLAHSFEDFPNLDPTGWLVSEKLDGVRAYWDGVQFVSRQGNVYTAPVWFKAGLPNEVLDGELWMARGAFNKTISVVKSIDSGDRWKAIKYVIFDAPKHGGTFTQRLAYVQQVCATINSQYVVAHPHHACKGKADLLQELNQIESLGGEGLMIRNPNSKYVVGRSDTLLKVKPFKDTEAVVIAHTAGKGRHAGRMGGLEVRMPSGVVFTVGTGFSDEDRRNPPPVGTTITYRYTELTPDGKPKCCSFLRVRPAE